jgi:hypothetical protein
VRRGVVLVGCQTYLTLKTTVIPGSPQLGTGAQFLNLPDFAQACPDLASSLPPGIGTSP